MPVIIYNMFVFDVATVIFPPSLDLAREQCHDHSNTGEKILNQWFRWLLKAGLSFDAATSGESMKKKKNVKEEIPFFSAPPLHFPFPFAFSQSVFLFLSLFTAYCCHCLI